MRSVIERRNGCARALSNLAGLLTRVGQAAAGSVRQSTCTRFTDRGTSLSAFTSRSTSALALFQCPSDTDPPLKPPLPLLPLRPSFLQRLDLALNASHPSGLPSVHSRGRNTAADGWVDGRCQGRDGPQSLDATSRARTRFANSHTSNLRLAPRPKHRVLGPFANRLPKFRGPGDCETAAWGRCVHGGLIDLEKTPRINPTASLRAAKDISSINSIRQPPYYSQRNSFQDGVLYSLQLSFLPLGMRDSYQSSLDLYGPPPHKPNSHSPTTIQAEVSETGRRQAVRSYPNCFATPHLSQVESSIDSIRQPPYKSQHPLFQDGRVYSLPVHDLAPHHRRQSDEGGLSGKLPDIYLYGPLSTSRAPTPFAHLHSFKLQLVRRPKDRVPAPFANHHTNRPSSKNDVKTTSVKIVRTWRRRWGAGRAGAAAYRHAFTPDLTSVDGPQRPGHWRTGCIEVSTGLRGSVEWDAVRNIHHPASTHGDGPKSTSRASCESGSSSKNRRPVDTPPSTPLRNDTVRRLFEQD
ncbi:hypothetical protein CVT26_009368 [Gymnopilus dilepis]|uniref:Uncharacterized protein n=1 Tax=Gymnopilus dilepis TaxID=231916 RepID=A0A409WZF0_9AGAR|nr:hypothetical protein CVT26_009368 [Gymnopilus dilepis]